MPIVVATGTNGDTANSYGSEGSADTYHEDRGNTSWTEASSGKEEALIRASQAIDAAYRSRFPGYKPERSQLLEWPRTAAYDANNYLIPGDEIPVEVINATFEAAIRELASPGSMIPDLERGGLISNIKAGSVSITYADGATPGTVFQIIDGILGGILSSSGGDGLFGVSSRG